MGRLGSLLRPHRANAVTTSPGPSPGSATRLAVVIPTLNEEATVATTIGSLAWQTRPASRIVVVDGGSTDRTADLAREAGATVVAAPRRGRGCQIAHIMPRISELIVLIAHADMVFSPRALETIERAMAERPDCPGGCLGHRFDRRTMGPRMVEWYDGLRVRLGGHAYGDQAQFFRREWLERMGGFPDQPIMEDVELSRRLRALGRPLCLNVPVTVSARRFERHGVARVVWANWVLRRAYRRGGSDACASLYKRYYANGNGNGQP
jgi:rSAM/selenodomain-associated transferase 2